MMVFLRITFLALAISLISCQSSDQPKVKKFQFNVGSDPAFAPFIQSAFETEQVRDTQYIGRLTFVPQETLIDSFLDKKFQLIFSGRKISSEEIDYLKSKQRFVRSYEIGWDAVTIIRNKSNPDSSITLEELKLLFTAGPPLIIDSKLGSNIQFLLDKLGLTDQTVKVIVQGNDSSVFEKVKSDINAIGIVSYSYLGDKDDPEIQKRIAEIQVCGIENEKHQIIKPSPDAFATDRYPLKRLIYMHSIEGVDGLSSGLAAFMLNDKGRRLLLKMSILPFTLPSREVEIVNEKL